MEESSGGKDGGKGLAAKVKDIDGKSKPKSILKPTQRQPNVGFENQFRSDFPEGLSSVNNGGTSSGGESGIGGNAQVHEKGDNVHGSFSYAEAVNKTKETRKVAFRELKNDMEVAGSDVVLPLASIKEVSAKFDNTLYGYFIGKRLAYPIVEQFARNAWAKFGFTRAMMNGKGFFFFQFDSKVGMDRVLEEGPWMIRNVPIIINVWTPTVSLSKEGNKVVPVWVKLHDVHLVAFTEDGLSLIATKLGKPKRLDGYTSDMCRDLWGRSSFARALVEISSEREMVEEIVIAIPSVDGEGYVKEKIRVEYDWKPPRCGTCCVFGHVDAKCVKNIAENPNIQKLQDEVDEEGFKKGNGKKQSNNKGSNKGGVPVNPKIIYKPVKHPLELPVYRKRAAEWKKKHPNASGSRYGQYENDKGAAANGSGDKSGSWVNQNRFSALDGDGNDQVKEQEQHDHDDSANINREGNFSEGASTPGMDGFNG